MSKSIMVPNWVLGVGKMVLPVVAAIAIGYGRFTALEKDNSRLRNDMSAASAKLDNLRDSVALLSGRQNVVELKQEVLQKTISESLVRIESSLKDVQSDVKEMQKKGSK